MICAGEYGKDSCQGDSGGPWSATMLMDRAILGALSAGASDVEGFTTLESTPRSPTLSTGWRLTPLLCLTHQPQCLPQPYLLLLCLLLLCLLPPCQPPQCLLLLCLLPHCHHPLCLPPPCPQLNPLLPCLDGAPKAGSSGLTGVITSRLIKRRVHGLR